jgi:hypothetical protein
MELAPPRDMLHGISAAGHGAEIDAALTVSAMCHKRTQARRWACPLSCRLRAFIGRGEGAPCCLKKHSLFA